MPSTPTSQSPRRSRTIDPAALAKRGVKIPDSWLRGVLAGAEGVLGAWLLLIVPTIAVYIATAAAPQLGSASWVESAQIGTGLWLAGHGAHLIVGESTFTLLPLGVTIVAFALTTFSIRRARLTDLAALGFTIVTYVVGTFLLSRVAGVPGSGRAIIGAALLATAASAWAVRKKRPAAPAWATRMGSQIKNWWAALEDDERLGRAQKLATSSARLGWATGGRVIGGILLVGTCGVVLAVIIGLPIMVTVQGRLEMDLVSSIVFTAGQLLLLPTVVIWGSSYLSGAGFSVGEGTIYSPTEVTNAPLPALPAFGALPNPESNPHPILGFSMLIIGVLAGWYIHRQVKKIGAGLPVVAGAAVATLIVAVAGVWLLSVLASGGFGPGRFATEVGPLTAPFMFNTGWQVATPMILVAVSAHPTTHECARRGWKKIRGSAGEVAK